jgi:hypothetical protein
MARPFNISTKQLQIDKANSTIVIVVGIAAFLTVFALVASKSLWERRSYQSRVIHLEEQARDQLEANIQAVEQLKISYQAFVSRPTNIISGDSQGTGELDGDNARIVLDALPSVYDFPALTSSLEKILVDRQYAITNISGTDNEAQQSTGQATNGTAAASQPSTQALEIPFEVGAQSDYKKAIDLLSVFRKSIRPFYIQRVTMTAGEDNLIEVRVSGKTYYQPEAALQITQETVK